jgi:hypothetical protein
MAVRIFGKKNKIIKLKNGSFFFCFFFFVVVVIDSRKNINVVKEWQGACGSWRWSSACSNGGVEKVQISRIGAHIGAK